MKNGSVDSITKIVTKSLFRDPKIDSKLSSLARNLQKNHKISAAEHA